MTLVAEPGRGAAEWIGVALRDLDLPPSTLIAFIRRGSEVVVPQGDTTVEEGDSITVIGSPEAIRKLDATLGSRGDSTVGASTTGS